MVDTREKNPIFRDGDRDFDVIHRKLDTGDYTITKAENLFVIERKASVNELYVCFTKDRKRFFNEIERMTRYPLRFLIVESSYTSLLNPFSYQARARVNYKEDDMAARRRAVVVTTNSIISLMLYYGIQVLFTGKQTEAIVRRLIKKVFTDLEKGRFKEFQNAGTEDLS